MPVCDFVLSKSRFPRTSFESTAASPGEPTLDRGDNPHTALPQIPDSHCWEVSSPYRQGYQVQAISTPLKPKPMRAGSEHELLPRNRRLESRHPGHEFTCTGCRR